MAETTPSKTGEPVHIGEHTAFFYGTLMVRDIFHSVVYNTSKPPPDIVARHTFTPAVLHGYVRHRVEGAAYPGIIASADDGASVRGKYVTGLSDANLERLDFFEGGQYERRTVTVKLLKRAGDAATGAGNVEGEARQAGVYVFRIPGDLEDKEWDFEAFQRDEMHNWTREGYVFEDCDPEDPAQVAEDQK
ncbi:AIG2-like family-domain-containing protein [Podospora conica]|nr:AIG2-like family-domain-containing protein [Schizothecium conicum]